MIRIKTEKKKGRTKEKVSLRYGLKNPYLEIDISAFTSVS